MEDSIEEGFEFPKEEPKIIKVIGVGGGGGNAVTHMYRKGIFDVSFLLCNTDKQALGKSEVPNKFVLGERITGGLGAGNIPEIGRQAAEESKEDIKKLLEDGTRMVFITAGMGGGTGTGAAPVIAGIAKEMGILTVGIVTIPFDFEGEPKIIQALKGVENMRKNVDALLVISNDRLLEVFDENEDSDVAFAKADDTLAIAAKSIAEIITAPGRINLDFADVNTTLRNGGVALMSNGYGEGDDRFNVAINDALTSPLLNNNDVFKAKKLLFNLASSSEAKLRIRELKEVRTFMDGFDKTSIHVKWGTSIDDSLGGQLKITILASGFGRNDIPNIDLLPGVSVDIDEDDEENARLLEEYGYTKIQGNEKNSGFKCIILTKDELDDDNIISLLEDNPTYNRNEKLIKEYRDAKRTTSGPSISISTSGGAKDRAVITF
ncbi:cell division protein FtsZ [Bacteroidia bacterium]|nr:cell division protein FtsZ [Bacteroidia bacterium]